MAAEAGVKTVVLTHLVGGPNPPGGADSADAAYVDAVRKQFAGEVIVGRDQLVL
jgi:ribonuclease BN (tRNA processing enzyme)